MDLDRNYVLLINLLQKQQNSLIAGLRATNNEMLTTIDHIDEKNNKEKDAMSKESADDKVGKTVLYI